MLPSPPETEPKSAELVDVAASGDASKLWQELRDKADDSLYFFSKVVLGYKELVDHLHQPLAIKIQGYRPNSKQRRGFLLPRGHFKSTILSKSYPLWRLAQNPELRILILGESATVGEKNLRDIKWHIENNQLFRWLYPELIPAVIGAQKWTEKEILLPRQGTFDESSITATGVGVRLTGTHYDIIIYDDLVGEEASKSEAVMQDAISYFQWATGLANDQDTIEELIAGTRWKHADKDLYGWIMKMMPGEWDWEQRSVIEDGVPIFPERFSEKIIDDIRRRLGEYKFSCNYMNSPISPEGGDFKTNQVLSYTVSADGKTIIPDDGTPPVRLADLYRISFWDPSAGGRSATAENAIIVAGMSADRRIFALAAWSKNTDMHAAAEKWLELNDRFHCFYNHYELVGSQKEIEKIIRDRLMAVKCAYCNKTHRRLKPLGVSPPGGRANKEERIRTFTEDAFGHITEDNKVVGTRIYLRRGMEKLRGQIVSFPPSESGSLVDEFDAFAYCCHLLRPPLLDTSNEEKSKEAEEVERRKSVPFTHTERDYGGYH
jgi:hypothetical protein